MLTPFILAGFFVAVSVSSALVALLAMAALKSVAGRRALAGEMGREPTIFLFDDADLIDATAPARALLAGVPQAGGDWARLLAYLLPKVPGLTKSLSDLPDRGYFELAASDGSGLQVRAEQIGQAQRLTLINTASDGQQMTVDSLSQQAQEEELTLLRDILGSLPIASWRRSAEGVIVWANEAYLDLAALATGEDALVWPLPDIFPIDSDPAHARGSKRLRIAPQVGGKDQWFDCQLLQSGSGQVGFALPADQIVRAERSLREFIQTLTKTFADLPIGLAIFDRQRQLALFNPALIDLTSLDGEFLSGRPTLFAFLDRLRETRILPEPKNYSVWRQKMIDLEKAAATGLYEETWLLTTGQTYRVTGRPHPEGAVAFLFEDISAEVSLTRRFRTEIELAQSVVDVIEDAVAVFSESGELVMSNRAYATLWGVDPRPSLGTLTIIDALRTWQSVARPSPIWGDLRDFVGEPGERAEWDGQVTMTDGRNLTCRISPMLRGATLVRFCRNTPERFFVRHSRRIRSRPDELTLPQ